MSIPMLGGIVRIANTSITGTWVYWNSRTDVARLIDEAGRTIETKGFLLMSDPHVNVDFKVGDRVQRKHGSSALGTVIAISGGGTVVTVAWDDSAPDAPTSTPYAAQLKLASPLPSPSGRGAGGEGGGEGVRRDHPDASGDMVAPAAPLVDDAPVAAGPIPPAAPPPPPPPLPSPSGRGAGGEGRGEGSRGEARGEDDLANIIDMLRRRIMSLEEQHQDALQLIAATARTASSLPSPSGRGAGGEGRGEAVRNQTLWQDDIQDFEARKAADADLLVFRREGWIIVHQELVVHPANYSVSRVVYLERTADLQPGQRTPAAAAAVPAAPRTTSTHVHAPTQPLPEGVTVVMHPPRHLTPSPLSNAWRGAAGEAVRGEADLDAQVLRAALAGRDAYRRANPPPVYRPFPSALP